MSPQIGPTELGIIAAIICCPFGLLAVVAGVILFVVQKSKQDKLSGKN